MATPETMALLARWNATVARLAEDAEAEMVFELEKSGVGDTGKLQRSIRSRIRLDYGEADRVSLRFRYYGLFIHHGVGRGWPKSHTSLGTKVLNDRRTRERKPVDWINPSVERLGARLGKEATSYFADLAIEQINFERALIR